MSGFFIKVIFAIIFLSASSCNYNRTKEGTTGAPQFGIQSLEKVDYNIVNVTVLAPKCVGCHSNAGGNKGGLNMETYQNVRNQLVRINFRTLEKMDMPPEAPLQNEEILILRAWLERGAPERYIDTGEGTEGNLEMGPTDWQKISEKIFAKKCFDCHSQPLPQGNLDLSSYTEVKSKAVVIFDRLFVKQDMPLEPYPALSVRERKVLLNWFNLGMPN